MIHVTQVEALPEYRLSLTFSDGTRGTANMRDTIYSFAPFEPLRDPNRFRDVRVEGGSVAWGEDLDIAPERLFALAHSLPSPDTFEVAQANELEVSFRQLRKMSEVPQQAMAERLEVTQAAVSRLENAIAEAKLTTIRKYLSALGWELELSAVQGGKRVRLNGV